VKVYEEPRQLRLPMDPNRSGGLHLSAILRHLALQMKVLDAKYDTPLTDDNSLMAQIGIAWEDYLAKHQFPNIEFHPGELICDGIAMSPDGISSPDSEDYAELIGVDRESWILEEFKSTRKSSRDFKEALRLKADKVKLWLWQIMSYRRALNRICEPGTECYVARLHVLFMNGNYSKDFNDPEAGPVNKIFRLVFSPEELDDNWLMVVSHRDYMQEIGALGDDRGR